MSTVSNSDVIEFFKAIERIRDSDMPEAQAAKKIEQIQHQIVRDLSFLVYSASKPYRKFNNYEDLTQEGFVGLIRAVRKFNYTLYPNFFLYAGQWIKHSVKRSASRFDIVYNPNRKRVLYAQLSPIEEEADPHTAEDIFFEREDRIRIRKALDNFSERDREIVKSTFGLEHYPPQTLREIGPKFNLTHERVRQIKNKITSTLQKSHLLDDLY